MHLPHLFHQLAEKPEFRSPSWRSGKLGAFSFSTTVGHKLLCLLMPDMNVTAGTIFLQLQPLRIVFLVLCRGICSLVTLATSQLDDHTGFTLLFSHI